MTNVFESYIHCKRICLQWQQCSATLLYTDYLGMTQLQLRLMHACPDFNSPPAFVT